MKLSAEVTGESHQIQLERTESGVSAEIDGRRYELGLRDLGGGEYLLKNGESIYDCHINAGHQKPEIIKVTLRGVTHVIRVVDQKRLRSGEAATQHDKGSVEIVAAMPGKVIRVLTEVGNQVETGTGIVVVEAMKMQNEMKSPKAGKVISISATPGATVNAGEVLAVIE
jgi:biotin carboxyl carrier protein